MKNIIKSLKELQESIAMASPSIATNLEIVRRLEAIIKEVNNKIKEGEYQEELNYKYEE